MILRGGSTNRYAVYVFHDDKGIVGDYVCRFLEGMRKVASRILVVVNGDVNKEGMEKLSRVSDEVFVRPNVGYDITAYKEGLLRISREELLSYDEAVICNDTLYGPIVPFTEMFDAMAEKDLDFWGITAFHGAPFDPFGTISYGFLPEHVQSFFQVFRKDFMATEDFRNWWEHMPAITRYEDAIGTHEAVFTKAMADKGYRWGVYCDASSFADYTWDPLRDFPVYLLKNMRCPVMKKRTFYHDYGEAFGRSGGEGARLAFDYIKNETEYPVDLIWEDLLRTCNMADLKKRLGLTEIISADIDETAGRKSTLKTALVIHIYYDELAKDCAEYAAHMPEGIDFFITVPDEEKLRKVKPHFAALEGKHKITYRISGNRGRDVAPFVVTLKDIVMNYDLILKIHDKKVRQIPILSIGHAWEYMCFECLLPTETFVKNVIARFEEDPWLGLLTPPVPVHGPYFPTTGNGEWGENYRATKDCADMLGLDVPMDEKKEPVAPLGSEFWVRTKALKSLFDHDWQYEEFPEEPVGVDGTAMHAIERIYPFCAQNEGYYSGWLMSDTYAAIHMDNWNYMNRTLMKAEAERTGGYRPFPEFLDRVRHS